MASLIRNQSSPSQHVTWATNRSKASIWPSVRPFFAFTSFSPGGRVTSLSHRSVRLYFSSTQERLERLHADEKNLYASFPDQPSYKVLARLCQNTYQKVIPNLGPWILHNQKWVQKNSYLGATFLNERDQQMAIVHRGTIFNDLKAWEQNRHGIVLHKVTDHLLDAYQYVVDAKKEAQARNCTLFQTGHSLGAWLAEVSAFLFALENNQMIPTYTFDSPGSRDFMEKYLPRSGERPMVLEEQNTKAFLSSLNPVNTLNKHLRAQVICPKIGKPEDYKGGTGFVQYLLDSHALENIIPAFDEQTGLPLSSKEVYDWPVSHRKTTFATKVFTSPGGTFIPRGVSGTINLCQLVLGDYLNFNTDEFKGWYKVAVATNSYDPVQESFAEAFMLEHGYRYSVREYNHHTTLNLAHLSLTTRGFLQNLKWFRKYAQKLNPNQKFVVERSPGIDSRILDILFKSEIGKETLEVPKGPITVYDLRRYLTHLQSLKPDALPELEKRCRYRVKGNNIQINIDKIKDLLEKSPLSEVVWFKKNFPESKFSDFVKTRPL